jgi:nucleolar pre-ribosomal-associated protein 2
VSGAEKTEHEAVVDGIIIPLMEAFSTARDLMSFAKRWHRELSHFFKLPSAATLKYHVWFDPKIRQHFGQLLQAAVSVKQLLSLLDWLEQQDLTDGAHLVILDAICGGITEEEFISNVGLRLFDAAFQSTPSSSLSELLALRWRIVGSTSTWISSDEIHHILENTKSSLSEVLQTGDLSDDATYEAFSCCTELSLAAFPNSKDMSDLSNLTSSFLQRLTALVEADNSVMAFAKYIRLVFSRLSKFGEVSGLGDHNIFKHSTVLYHLLVSHLHRLTEDESSQLQDMLGNLARSSNIQDDELLIDTYFEPFIEDLNDLEACHWTNPNSASTISSLLKLPKEAFTRDRRKRIMSSWKNWRARIEEHSSGDVHYAAVVLRLLITVMQQPTFYTVSQRSFLLLANILTLSLGDGLRRCSRLFCRFDS